MKKGLSRASPAAARDPVRGCVCAQKQSQQHRVAPSPSSLSLCVSLSRPLALSVFHSGCALSLCLTVWCSMALTVLDSLLCGEE